MFGKEFAYQYQGAGGEEGNFPWMRGEREWHGPRHVRMHQGHSPFGQWGRGPRFFGMRRGRGPFGPFGPGGDGPRFFGRGDMKFALLELVQDRPMHGYEMMKALEEKSGGFYSPSPGSIYPTLQMLEDRGFVTSKDDEGKKVYSITDAGRTLLSERQKNEEDFAGPPWMRHRGFGRQQRFSPELQALKSETIEVVRLLTIAGRMSFQDPQQLSRLRGIIEHARKDLTDMIYTAGSQQEQASSPTSANQSEGPSVEQV